MDEAPHQSSELENNKQLVVGVDHIILLQQLYLFLQASYAFAVHRNYGFMALLLLFQFPFSQGSSFSTMIILPAHL
jgi:hypothetical protein